MSKLTDLEAVRQRYQPIARTVLGIAGSSIVVRSNDRSLIDALNRYFYSYVGETVPSDARVIELYQGTPALDFELLRDVSRGESGKLAKEAAYDAPDARIVLKRRTGVVIYVADLDHVVVGDLIANFNQAVNVVNMVYEKAKLAAGYVMLHAAGTLGPAGGVAIASLSGSGKTTLALQLLERGHRFVSNDRLLFRAIGLEGEMVGVPKLPRANPGTLLGMPRLAGLIPEPERVRLRQLPPDELWGLEQKYDVDVNRFYGPETFQLTGALCAVYLLRWSRQATGWHVRLMPEVERRNALDSVVKGVEVYEMVGPSHAVDAHLTALAQLIPFYEVTGQTDVARLADAIAANPTP